MSPEREPMENDSNSRTAEELEQQTVDVYVERALHGPVFRMSYEHTHTYCEIFYLKSGTCTYTVNQGQWHLEAGDLFIVAAGDPHSTRYEGKTSCERIIVFCKSDVLAGMMRGDPTEVQQALERYCNLSPTYFSRKFRLITGQTFKEHVNYIRLRQATQMLLMTDNSITKIAMLCGFGSSNYFKDLFRASTGRSPREYRKHSGLPIHPHLRDNG